MPKIISFLIALIFILPCSIATAQDHLIDKKQIDNPKYLFDLGLKYLEGNGVPKSKQDAYSFILRAARLGYTEAQYRMGKSYFRAEFTDLDVNMSVYWYKKAATQKHLQASLMLADIYDRDSAEPESSAELIALYNNILDSVADSNIMLMYGNLYSSDKYGVSENLDSARFWYTKALEQGNEYAQELIDGLEKKQWGSGRTTITDVSYKKRIPKEKRNLKAIIVGNFDYPDGYLPNPKNDVKDIREMLESLDFETKLYMNLFSDDLRDSVFQQIREAEDYDVILFYYAGHGIQRNNINYMIPVDADIRMSSQTFLAKCLRVDEVTNMLNAHNDGCKIIILDACRENRYLAKSSRGGKMKGLSSSSLNASNSFIVFSTQPGEIALDGITGSKNSPFAQAFIEELDKPNVPILKLFDNVKNRVNDYTDGEQTPVYMSNMRGSFVFNRQ